MRDGKARRLANPAYKVVNKFHVPVTSTATLTGGKIYTTPPFNIDKADTVNRLSMWMDGSSQAHGLIMLALYDGNGNLIADTGIREVPPTPSGMYDFAIPDTLLTVGKYYAALWCHSTVTAAVFGINSYMVGGGSGTTATLPTTLTGIIPSATVPAITVKAKETLVTKGLFTIETLTYGVWAIVGTTIWGISGSYFFTSTNDAVSWTQMMHLPAGMVGTQTDVVIYSSKIYLLSSEGKLYQSSDLTSAATWTDITSPNINPVAKGRVLGIEEFNGNIMQSEYSTGGTMELAAGGGPKIHRYNVAGATWYMSLQLANCRHFHSFIGTGGSALYVSVGDSSSGTDIGYWRITSANVGVASGSNADTWTKYTSPVSPNTANYTVDYVLITGQPGITDGIYGASDRPGTHLQYTKQIGTVGSFNVSNQCYRTNGDPTETVRGLYRDNTSSSINNLYWFTAETLDPALYMSPPPYTQSYKLYSFPSSIPFIGRSLPLNGYFYNYVSKIKFEKFVGQ